MTKSTELLFLGASACLPRIGDDTASFLVGGEVLVDTGWNVSNNLRQSGVDPASVHHLLFTHMHHDHMMSLPAFLYSHISHGGPLPTLTIYGPCETVERPVKDALAFLQTDLYWPWLTPPCIRPLKPHDSFEVGRFSVCAMPSLHAVPGRCYRLFDHEAGVTLGFGGDTAYQKPYGDFFRDCDVLVYEYSHGLSDPGINHSRHSGLLDAARVAADAHVGALCLVHGPELDHAACEDLIRPVYPGAVYWPRRGDRMLIRHSDCMQVKRATESTNSAQGE